MGVDHNVYLGPYAECLVRSEDPAPYVDDVAKGKLLETWGFRRAWGVSEPPTVAVDGIVYQRYCFVQGASRPGEPEREMDYSGSGIEDLRAVNTQAEIDWFARAFRKELRALEKFCGRPARLGWGVVAWFS
jgi:hypothetical protein